MFRSAEGFWVLRVYFSVRNNGAAPVDVDRAHFKVQDLDQRDDFGTFAAHTGLNPAQTVEGDMAWWLPGTERQPANLQVRYRPGEGDNPPTLWERSFNLAFSPAQPAHGHAPSRPVYNLPVTVVAGSGRTWARPDQPRRVFAQVTVQNTLDVPLAIQRDMFRLALTPGDVQGFEAPEGAALAETVELAPGASVTGGIGYLFTNSAAAPTAATFTFGAANSPQVTAQVPLTAVPAPAE